MTQHLRVKELVSVPARRALQRGHRAGAGSAQPAPAGPLRRSEPACALGGPCARRRSAATPGCGAIRSRHLERRPVQRDDLLRRPRAGPRPHLGQIIAVPPRAAPSLRDPPAVPAARPLSSDGEGIAPRRSADFPCPPAMYVFLWGDSPGTLELTFKGGTRAQNVGYGPARGRFPPAGAPPSASPSATPQAQLPAADAVGARSRNAARRRRVRERLRPRAPALRTPTRGERSL